MRESDRSDAAAGVQNLELCGIGQQGSSVKSLDTYPALLEYKRKCSSNVLEHSEDNHFHKIPIKGQPRLNFSGLE